MINRDCYQLKMHYDYDKNNPCKNQVDSTQVQADVTCKRCLKLIEYVNKGHFTLKERQKAVADKSRAKNIVKIKAKEKELYQARKTREAKFRKKKEAKIYSSVKARDKALGIKHDFIDVNKLNVKSPVTSVCKFFTRKEKRQCLDVGCNKPAAFGLEYCECCLDLEAVL